MIKISKLLALFLLVSLISLLIACGDDNKPSTSKQDPQLSDFNIGELTHTFDGSAKAVTITAKDGKSDGTITVYYEGTGSTVYPQSTTAPTAVGTYSVTFDVAAAKGWNAVTGLAAGTLTINAANQNPVADDFDIDNLTQTEGSVTAVTIEPKEGKSSGTITIYYEGTGGTTYAKSTTLPTEVGTYTVTFDVAASTGFNAATGLAAGTLTIEEAFISMVWIEPGTFSMGSPATEPSRGSDEIQHQVTLTKGFYMGKYLVTQEQYEAVMGINPSSFVPSHSTIVSAGITDTSKHPVERVRWYEAIVFCNKLSIMEGRSPAYSIDGKTNPAEWGDVPTSWDASSIWNTVEVVSNSTGYRLPTEAQWEYACRAGTTTPFNTGNNITTDQANYDGRYPYNNNPAGVYLGRTTEVGSYAANTWGLYDMHGNVWEWCWDWFGDYASGAQRDPQGPNTGTSRVNRGGSWLTLGQGLRSAFRVSNRPSNRDNITGFRLVRNAN